MTPVPTLASPAPAPRSGAASRPQQGADAFSKVLNTPADHARHSRSRPHAEPETPRDGTAPRQGSAEDATSGTASGEGTPEIAAAQERQLSPLERLALMFGETAVRDGSETKGPSGKEEVENQQSPPSEDGDEETNEAEAAEAAGFALVTRNSPSEPKRALAGETAKDTSEKKPHPETATARAQNAGGENRQMAEPAADQGELTDDQGGRPATRAVDQTVQRDGKADLTEDENRPASVRAKGSGQAEMQVKVVSDTLTVAPVAPDTSRTVTGLATAIAEDGEWRTAIEQLNSMGADVPKSSTGPRPGPQDSAQPGRTRTGERPAAALGRTTLDRNSGRQLRRLSQAFSRPRRDRFVVARARIPHRRRHHPATAAGGKRTAAIGRRRTHERRFVGPLAGLRPGPARLGRRLRAWQQPSRAGQRCEGFSQPACWRRHLHLASRPMPARTHAKARSCVPRKNTACRWEYYMQ